MAATSAAAAPPVSPRLRPPPSVRPRSYAVFRVKPKPEQTRRRRRRRDLPRGAAAAVVPTTTAATATAPVNVDLPTVVCQYRESLKGGPQVV